MPGSPFDSRVKEVNEKINDGIENLISELEKGKSENLVNYLEFCAKFHNYSSFNQILIFIQNPGAVHCAGFNKWKSLNRFVKKGEKGLDIFAPTFRKTKKEIEKENGEKEVKEITSLRGFIVVKVFDISQTDGEPLPELRGYEGNGEIYVSNMETFIKGKEITLDYGYIPGTILGYSKKDSSYIMVSDTVIDKNEVLNVLIHEYSHQDLHRNKYEYRGEISRQVKELEAESVAYIVMYSLGIKCNWGIDYINMYNGNVELFKKSLNFIQKTSGEILNYLLAQTESSNQMVA